MNALSLLQPTGRDSGCSLLAPFWKRLVCLAAAPAALLLRVSTAPPWLGTTCFLGQICGGSAHLASIGNVSFYMDQPHWQTFVGSSLLPPGTRLKPQRLCPGFGTMPCQWVQVWYFHWNMNFSYFFSCPSFVHVTLDVWIQILSGNLPGAVAIRATVLALQWFYSHVLPIGVYIIQYKLTSVI